MNDHGRRQSAATSRAISSPRSSTPAADTRSDSTGASILCGESAPSVTPSNVVAYSALPARRATAVMYRSMTSLIELVCGTSMLCSSTRCAQSFWPNRWYDVNGTCSRITTLPAGFRNASYASDSVVSSTASRAVQCTPPVITRRRAHMNARRRSASTSRRMSASLTTTLASSARSFLLASGLLASSAMARSRAARIADATAIDAATLRDGQNVSRCSQRRRCTTMRMSATVILRSVAILWYVSHLDSTSPTRSMAPSRPERSKSAKPCSFVSAASGVKRSATSAARSSSAAVVSGANVSDTDSWSSIHTLTGTRRSSTLSSVPSCLLPKLDQRANLGARQHQGGMDV